MCVNNVISYEYLAYNLIYWKYDSYIIIDSILFNIFDNGSNQPIVHGIGNLNNLPYIL